MNFAFDLFANVQEQENSLTLIIPSDQMKLHPYQTEILKQNDPLFLPCMNVALSSNEISFTYQKSSAWNSFSHILSLTKLEKYLILLKTGDWFKNTKRRYGISFDPRNLFFTYAYDFAFMFRILPNTIPESAQTEADEFEEYKALILSVLQNKYSYEQLIQIGLDVLEKDTFFSSVIDAQTPDELKQLITGEYNKLYIDTKENQVGFRAITVRILVIAITVIMISLLAALAYFIYRNVTETNIFATKLHIYENFNNKKPLAVVDHARNLPASAMDEDIKKVIADALIATHEPENLEWAFYLNHDRQVEVVQALVELDELDIIATLQSDKNKIQIYQVYYAKDYERVIYLVENNTELTYDAQAQLLCAQAYMNLGDYIKAEDILVSIGDDNVLLEAYKEHKEYIIRYETNIEYRKKLLDSLDPIITALEKKLNKQE